MLISVRFKKNIRIQFGSLSITLEHNWSKSWERILRKSSFFFYGGYTEILSYQKLKRTVPIYCQTKNPSRDFNNLIKNGPTVWAVERCTHERLQRSRLTDTIPKTSFLDSWLVSVNISYHRNLSFQQGRWK